jgi:predicted AAA+ superfamily ATPase
MIERHLAAVLRDVSKKYPVLTVTGPRQSGKTTLVRATFPKHAYVSLELPDQRAYALEDPRGFLAQFEGPVILDEVQRAPELLSYIQVLSDEDPRAGHYVLTGSQNFLLVERISQSLAGRAHLSHLLPLAKSELSGRKPIEPHSIGSSRPRTRPDDGDLCEVMWKGFYPRIHDQNLSPQQWLASYFQTYLERDVRELTQVGDLESFGRFVRLCAGRCGQLLNLSSLANDCSISHDTARRWLSLLEASFAVFLLRPHHRNFNKRLVKSPKLFFVDTGLLCFLLRIRTAQELRTHSMRGPVFENFVIGELLKNFHNRGELPDIYFWRDHRGNEVDLIVDCGDTLIPVEIKSGQTVVADFFRALDYWRHLAGESQQTAALVYGGDDSQKRRDIVVYSWRQWA